LRNIYQKATTVWHANNSLIEMTMSRWLTTRKDMVTAWMRMGISPRRLALTLALGFAIGCLPVVGIPTALCALVAVALKLNLPAIQAANYAAMPLQLALILPFVRLGNRMFAPGQQPALGRALAHGSTTQMLWASSNVASQALGAWLVIAGPMVLLMTLGLTAVLQRVPAMASNRGE
jgi:uncharacterized protein (DUF2062 family)